MRGYALLGAREILAHKPSTKWSPTAMVAGGVAAGAGVGMIMGRSMHGLVVGAIFGGVLGLAGCTEDNLAYDPPDAARVLEERGALDMLVADGEVTKGDLGLLEDLGREDMTWMLDMSKPNCVTTLSGVGAGDFTIRFTIFANDQTASNTVMHQRAQCSADESFWDIQLRPNGGLAIDIGAGSGDYSAVVTSNIKINDGDQHTVVITRRNGIINMLVDGNLVGNGSAPQSLGNNLPPFGVAKGNPCEVAGLKPLSGWVKDICITVP